MGALDWNVDSSKLGRTLPSPTVLSWRKARESSVEPLCGTGTDVQPPSPQSSRGSANTISDEVPSIDVARSRSKLCPSASENHPLSAATATSGLPADARGSISSCTLKREESPDFKTRR